jgi:uncharacterized protein with PIN domain
MPKIICNCNEILSYSEIPCKIQYKFISDVEFDKIQGNIDAEDLYLKMKSFLMCPKCSRLWIFWNGFSQKATEYKIVDNI